ncbi:MAG: hypothetical protein OXH16_15570 [Gemmatimonadetes bacterium]|nr:hypothetical protein [Gemmatimonadota bacterium]
MALLTDEELLETLEKQLPALLERHPEMELRIYAAFIRTFATKEEVAAVLSELRDFRGEFDAFQSKTEKFQSGMETFRSEVNDRFEKVDERFDLMDQRFSDLRDWVEMIVGRFQTRSGRKLEDVVAGTMRLVLGRDDVLSEHVRLRQPLEDADGMIGPSGRRYEVDILVDNSTLLVFEVKSVCEVEDVDRFADKVGLMRTLHPDKTVDGVIVTMAPLDEVETRCVEWGIKLVH